MTAQGQDKGLGRGDEAGQSNGVVRESPPASSDRSVSGLEGKPTTLEELIKQHMEGRSAPRTTQP